MNQPKPRESEIRLLPTLTQSIREAPDFQTTLTIVLSQVCEVTNCDYGEAWTPSPEGTVLELSPVWYINTRKDSTNLSALEQFRLCSEGFIFPPTIGLPGRVWSSQQPEWICDASAESENFFLRNQIAKAFGVRAGFGVPILAHHQVLTVLVFFMSEVHEADARMIELATGVATLFDKR